MLCPHFFSFFFFFNDTATTEIYTLSLHDALPIFIRMGIRVSARDSKSLDELILILARGVHVALLGPPLQPLEGDRSEEHTSELQSRLHLVCRLLLEKKKKINK